MSNVKKDVRAQLDRSESGIQFFTVWIKNPDQNEMYSNLVNAHSLFSAFKFHYRKTLLLFHSDKVYTLSMGSYSHFS